ncbi:MAG TPA: hypothetical protein VEC57_06845 [Candidatus Limnocylindrales bacterium]|nr:hypothetical protein [Candidatus Limnocylindrales bacterium]
MPRRLPLTILLTVVVATGGCAHQRPYYRFDIDQSCAACDVSAIDARLLLIGDAGDPNRAGEPVLQLLTKKARELPERTTVVFLGDNVYERGMPKVDMPDPLAEVTEASKVLLPDLIDTRKEAERCLNSQIDVVRGTQIPAIFIPGNHDWDQFELGGWDRILEQGKFIEAARQQGNNVMLLPAGGCPGPVSIPLGTRGMLIAMDTQWFLETRADGKPTADNNPTGCFYVTEGAVHDGLVTQLQIAAREGRRAVVAAHHPLESYGPHGGFVEGWTHLFPMRFLRHYVPFYMEWVPMPVVGTMMVWARQYFSPSPQDFSNARNEQLRAYLRLAMAEAEKKGAPALVYAAGHDHSLQVFRTHPGPHYALVSGLGARSRASAVGAANHTLFAHSSPDSPGFMQLDFLKDGTVRLSVIEVTGHEITEGTETVTGDEVFSMVLTAGRKPPVTRWQRWRQRFLPKSGTR